MSDAAKLAAATALRHGHWLALAAGVAVALAFALKIAPGYELWFDELCTLFYADPAAPLDRLAGDTHPPVYYAIVRLLLTLGLGPLPALWLVNIACIAGALSAVWWFMRRAGHGAFAIAIAGLVLVTPGLLRYLLEGRDYAMAQGACLALAAAAIARLDAGAYPRERLVLGGLALLCGAVHMYSGIFAGAIGGSLTVLGVIRKDRALMVAGLVTGAAASLVTLAWSLFILPLANSGHPFISWLTSEKHNATIPSHLWTLATLTGGKLANLGLLAAGVALCWASPAARRHVLLLVMTTTLFVGLPVLVSLAKPMITGRYLVIAAPALVMIAGFVGWRAATSMSRPALAAAGAAAIALFGLSLAVLGPSRAEETIAASRRPYTANRVDQLLEGTPPRALRIKSPDLPDWGAVPVKQIYLSNFRFALHRRSDIWFDSSLDGPRDVAGLPAGLVGWSEDHPAEDGKLPTTPDAALAALGLTNASGRKVIMEPTKSGFLLLLE